MLNAGQVLSLLRDGAENFKLKITCEAWHAIEQYLNILLQWSVRINLFSRRSSNTDLARLILSSILVNKIIDLNKKNLLDIGSGAGLPGLMLELAYPSKLNHTTLCEPRYWRNLFLSDVVSKLNRKDRVTITNQRAEMLQGQYDIITARAVTTANKLSSLIKHLVDEASIMVMFGKGEAPTGWIQTIQEITIPAPIGGIQTYRLLRIIAQ